MSCPKKATLVSAAKNI